MMECEGPAGCLIYEWVEQLGETNINLILESNQAPAFNAKNISDSIYSKYKGYMNQYVQDYQANLKLKDTQIREDDARSHMLSCFSKLTGMVVTKMVHDHYCLAHLAVYNPYVIQRLRECLLKGKPMAYN